MSGPNLATIEGIVEWMQYDDSASDFDTAAYLAECVRLRRVFEREMCFTPDWIGDSQAEHDRIMRMRDAIKWAERVRESKPERRARIAENERLRHAFDWASEQARDVGRATVSVSFLHHAMGGRRRVTPGGEIVCENPGDGGDQ